MPTDPAELLLATLLYNAVYRRDTRAARLLLDRFGKKPQRKLDLPGSLATAADVATAANALLRAMAAGDITPQDAQRVASVLELARRAVETEDLERRVVELERRR